MIMDQHAALALHSGWSSSCSTYVLSGFSEHKGPRHSAKAQILLIMEKLLVLFT